MDLQIENSGNVLVARLPERVGSHNADALEGDLLLALGDGSVRFVFDFSGVDYISSPGLRLILIAAKRINVGKGRLAVSGLRPHIHEIFDIGGFLSILEVCEELNSALAFTGA